MANRNTNNDKKTELFLRIYSTQVGKNSKKAREAIQKLHYKGNHSFLQMIAQTYLDEAIFEKKDFRRKNINYHKLYYAKYYIEKALKLNQDCLKAIWVYAKVYEKYKYPRTAIMLYRKIIKNNSNNLIHNYCIEDEETVLMIRNDALFELYRNYYPLNKKLSDKYLHQYRMGILKGIKTIYSPFAKYKVSDFT